jgi:FtsP/CotA-like multicopper oxidase with cupredoxin domain
MMKLNLSNIGILLITAAFAAFGQPTNCPRFGIGATAIEPENLFSNDGVLEVSFTYHTRVDQFGNRLFCFMTQDGAESPTLHVKPGDKLIVHVENAVPVGSVTAGMRGMGGMSMAITGATACGATTMTPTSVNVHYHGTNTPPTCHQDEVIRTIINSGDSFTYALQFPQDEPPGLYWYHPHIHGIAEAAVLGGASGALIVEGIQNVNPLVAGLRSRVLVIRDNPVPASNKDSGAPAWDVSLNYVPVPYPAFTPAVVHMRSSEKQFWRVLNASADTIIDVQVQYDGVPQTLTVIGLDGVPIGSQDGNSQGSTLSQTDILLAPAARAEFIVSAPSATVKNAQLVTLNVDTGPGGDYDPTRPLASIKLSKDSDGILTVPAVSGAPSPGRFAGLANITPAVQRKLYFSEVLSDPNNPLSPTNFYITVDGQTPTLFDSNNPPAITTQHGAVEDWTIENRTLENHEFHIHQIHFLLLEQNRVAVKNGQYLDMIQVPYWTGAKSDNYPSVKVRMDFRGPTVGDFVYHCHILGHEDNGMMAIIRVQ